MGARPLSKAKPCLSAGLGRGAAPGPAAGSLHGGTARRAPGNAAAGWGRWQHLGVTAAPLCSWCRAPAGGIGAQQGQAFGSGCHSSLIDGSGGTELMGQDGCSAPSFGSIRQGWESCPQPLRVLTDCSNRQVQEVAQPPARCLWCHRQLFHGVLFPLPTEVSPEVQILPASAG